MDTERLFQGRGEQVRFDSGFEPFRTSKVPTSKDDESTVKSIYGK